MDPASREEDDGVKIIPIARVVKKLFMKNFSPKTYFFLFGDLSYLRY